MADECSKIHQFRPKLVTLMLLEFRKKLQINFRCPENVNRNFNVLER